MPIPNTLLIGQITVDDTVPSAPAVWQRKLGGNALYSLAGARLWCGPEQLGVVARVPCDLPFDVGAILREIGVSTEGLVPCEETALIEWILYEEDGNRQSMPRNPELRDPAADLNTLHARYLKHIGAISASVTDIPPTWIAAQAVHLAPQIVERHSVSAHELASQVQFLSIDPSPHYSRGLLPQQLYDLLSAATAFLPSQAEVEHLSGAGAWADIVMDLVRAGFAEVIVKRGSAGCLVATSLSDPQLLPVAPANPVDLTGAGDAFSGAYTVNRAMGVAPVEAAMRASVSAAMIIECSGTEEAFRLVPAEAERRFNNYRAEEKR